MTHTHTHTHTHDTHTDMIHTHIYIYMTHTHTNSMMAFDGVMILLSREMSVCMIHTQDMIHVHTHT